MKKIHVIGAAAALRLALHRIAAEAIREEIEIVQLQQFGRALRERAPVPAVDLGPPAYAGFGRKGKGEKKRAASARRGKGWK